MQPHQNSDKHASYSSSSYENNEEKEIWCNYVTEERSPIVNGGFETHSNLSTPFSLAASESHNLISHAQNWNSWNGTPEVSRGVPDNFGPFDDYDAEIDEGFQKDELDDINYGKRNRNTAQTLGFIFSVRGLLNVGALMLLTLGLVMVFAVLPIITYLNSHSLSKQLIANTGGYNLGGINGSGQVPVIQTLQGLIDPTTPRDAMSRQGFDGNQYNLVFSDEFSTDGRTFWPGDDPYWEAVDLHYWPTGDFEWYDPDAITTADGKLQITITKEDIHNLNYRSGMLQSWNKLCFTGGYIEVSISLPGTPKISGFWPGAWTMGNLGRAGYGATTDGTWPYSYSSCDLGTLRNQTSRDGTGPLSTLNANGGRGLSFLPGQKLSSCTCSGEEHPGPSTSIGRGAPEIDIIEAQVRRVGGTNIGEASQSAQFAPFDDAYEWNVAGASVFNSTISSVNTYKGGVYQEAISVVTRTDQTAYQDNGGNFQKFGFEYSPGASGYITWSLGDTASWTVNPTTVAPNRGSQISQRLISEEPMYIILNLAISESFETVDLDNLVTPNKMLVDYVRVYQRKGYENIGCSPKNFPTEKYIKDHISAYTNNNLTTWDQAGQVY
ncbi:beta-glucan synthesis-associated [Phakopsora pachyrhizi]|nr:beta-glucan synthesis-associated [Phakopsora pachyrhizi]